jgi:hypothetical protein
MTRDIDSPDYNDTNLGGYQPTQDEMEVERLEKQVAALTADRDRELRIRASMIDYEIKLKSEITSLKSQLELGNTMNRENYGAANKWMDIAEERAAHLGLCITWLEGYYKKFGADPDQGSAIEETLKEAREALERSKK